ncbi:MAG: tetratricopeptide repeat protein [Phycisphaerae bacterium]|jgi:tetratricopeptide (TPR) repeat protein|nr:tetratricopeptide repeat protein [Phycisphaerae bacterium]
MLKRFGWIEILFLAAMVVGIVCIVGMTWKPGTGGTGRETERNKDLTVVGRGVSSYGEKYKLASALLDRGKISQAEVIYKTLVEFEPTSPYPHIGLATCCTKRGDHAGALQSYEKAFEMDPKSPYALVGMGAAYIGMSDYAKAIEKYTAALALDAEMPQVHWGLAVASAHLGEKARARRHLKRFKKLTPDSTYVKSLESAIEAAVAQPATQPDTKDDGE